MNEMTLLIKPNSSVCNLNCNYCFCKNVGDNGEILQYDFMNISILEDIIKKSLIEDIKYLNFIIQRCDFNLIELEFYKQLIDLQYKYNTKNIKIKNYIQINSINLDDKLAKFLSDNNFSIDICLNSLEYLNNLDKMDYKNNDSFKNIIDGINKLKNYKIDFNILLIITKQSAKYIDKIYQFCKDNDFKIIQFVPCMMDFDYDKNSDDEIINIELKHYLDTNNFYVFLDKIFEIWYKDVKNGTFIEIKNFMDYILILNGSSSINRSLDEFDNINMVIDSNGDIYPCDFYYIDLHKLANVKDINFNKLISSHNAKIFFERYLYITDVCKKCKYFKLCGEGYKHNVNFFVHSVPSFNYQCKAIKKFLDSNLNKLIQVSNIIQK